MYAKAVKTYRFFLSILMLSDVQPALSRMSRHFQQAMLDYSELQLAIKTATLSLRRLAIEPGELRSSMPKQESTVKALEKQLQRTTAC